MAAELRWERSVDQRQRALLTRSRSTCRRARDVARPWRRHTSCDAVSIPVLCPRRGPGPTLGPDQNRRDGRATLSTTESSVTQAARFVTLRSFRVLPDHPAGTYGRIVHQERPRDLARRRCSNPWGPPGARRVLTPGTMGARGARIDRYGVDPPPPRRFVSPGHRAGLLIARRRVDQPEPDGKASVSLATPLPQPRSPLVDVVVVGAGVMGAAAAWQPRPGRREGRAARPVPGRPHPRSLARRLAHLPPCRPSPGYLRRAVEALPLWRELEAETGAQLLTITGGVDHGDSATTSPRSPTY